MLPLRYDNADELSVSMIRSVPHPIRCRKAWNPSLIASSSFALDVKFRSSSSQLPEVLNVRALPFKSNICRTAPQPDGLASVVRRRAWNNAGRVSWTPLILLTQPEFIIILRSFKEFLSNLTLASQFFTPFCSDRASIIWSWSRFVFQRRCGIAIVIALTFPII